MRGEFSLEGRPLLADSEGPFGTPITDSERVKLTAGTAEVWLVAYLPDSVTTEHGRDTLRDLLASMQRYFFLGLDLGDFGGEMRDEHEELVARIRNGRKSELVECLQAQIVASRDRILHALAEQDIGIPIN